jgi:hypothetical protein
MCLCSRIRTSLCGKVPTKPRATSEYSARVTRESPVADLSCMSDANWSKSKVVGVCFLQHHTEKTNAGLEVKFDSFLTSALDGESSPSRSDRFTSLPISGPQILSTYGGGEKCPWPASSKIAIALKLILNHYTDWAIPVKYMKASSLQPMILFSYLSHFGRNEIKFFSTVACQFLHHFYF